MARYPYLETSRHFILTAHRRVYLCCADGTRTCSSAPCRSCVAMATEGPLPRGANVQVTTNFVVGLTPGETFAQISVGFNSNLMRTHAPKPNTKSRFSTTIQTETSGHQPMHRVQEEFDQHLNPNCSPWSRKWRLRAARPAPSVPSPLLPRSYQPPPAPPGRQTFQSRSAESCASWVDNVRDWRPRPQNSIARCSRSAHAPM